jgi:uncharacterized membrane protein
LTNALLLLDTIVLFLHLFSAIFFVGGSFFMWFVVVPASHLITNEEHERTQIVGKIAKQFGRLTHPTLGLLIITGLYDASWYLRSAAGLFEYPGTILLSKMILVVVLLILVYVNNLYLGRRIVRLAREGNLGKLKELRRRSRVLSAVNLSLMLAIILLAVMMQLPP